MPRQQRGCHRSLRARARAREGSSKICQPKAGDFLNPSYLAGEVETGSMSPRRPPVPRPGPNLAAAELETPRKHWKIEASALRTASAPAKLL